MSQSADTHWLRPAIPVALALTVGIAVGGELPGQALLAALIFLLGAVGSALGLKRGRPARWSPLVAVLAAGYLALTPWGSPTRGPDHLVNYLDDGYWRIHGTIVDQPTVRFQRTRTILAIEALSRDERTRPVQGRIRLTVTGEVPLSPGDRIVFPARIRPLRNFNNPGGFDYRRYMAFKGVHGSAWVPAEKLRVVGVRPLSPPQRMVNGMRGHLTALMDAAGGDRAVEAKTVLKALIVGDRSGIDSSLRERFNRAGVGHLLAISGLHVGIVAAVTFKTLLWLASFCPPLLWRGWGRQWAAAATILAAAAYGVLAGMSPSTQRAVIMVTVFLAAIILGRDHDMMNTLALAALAILALFPPALFSISFQLSFTAVVAIVYGLEKIGGNVEQLVSSSVGRRLVGFVVVSALAIAGTSPIVLYHFNQTSLVGIGANLILVPLVGFIAVPLGLTAAVLAGFSASAAVLVFQLCIQILTLAMAVVDAFSALPFAAVKTVTPSALEIGLYYLAGWALLNIRKTTVGPWVLAAALVVAAGDAVYWSYQRFWHNTLRVTAIDVGQGACTLLELPGGEVWLYDGGGFSDNRLFDMGQRVVAPVLWRRKIATVDTLVLSHPNADHLNGLIYVASHFNVRELWTNGDVNHTRGYQDLMSACRRNGVVVRRMAAGGFRQADGPVRLTVLHPPADYYDRQDKIDRDDRNSGSLVLKASFGRTAFLLTGDITRRAEKELLQRSGGALASTVLFVPHHGSRTSSSPNLLAAVDPQLAVVSAGAGNRFGFPHPEVMARYRDVGCRVLGTASHGAISMRSDGQTVRIRPFSKTDEYSLHSLSP